MKEYILQIIMVILLLVTGWAGHGFYDDYTKTKLINGLWISGNNLTEVKAENYAQKRDGSNQWICINIDDKMDIKEIQQTCVHESMHEAYARYCMLPNNEDNCINTLAEMRRVG